MEKARYEDIPALMDIYRANQKIMHAAGNDQWKGNYPEPLLASDIDAGRLYLARDEAGRPLAVVAAFFGDDPTYAEIRGSWPDPSPYLTLHRIAVDPALQGRGIAGALFRWAEDHALAHGVRQLRIDTHAANAPMKAVLSRLGYRYCGIIVAADGTDRDAYYKSLS